MATRTRKHTYTRVKQCSHASVGLAQARPNHFRMHSETLYIISAVVYVYFVQVWMTVTTKVHSQVHCYECQLS